MTATLPPPTEPLITRREAAAIIGVAEQTLALWQSTGRYSLPCIKVGRLVRYRRADLERWLESRTTNGGN